MKALTTLFTALALLSPLVTSAADFEGTIKLKMTAERGQSLPMSLSMKGGLTRMDMQADETQTSMIMDPAKQTVTILMPEQRMYMVHAIPQHAMAGAQDKADDTTVEKTSVREKILGYDTTKYIAKSKGETTEIWITEELGTFAGLGAGGGMGGPGQAPGKGRGAQAWEKAFKGKQAFPLRVITRGKNGKEDFRMETTAVEKKSLPDSLFQPPAGFQKLDMGGMMRGMGMPGAMPPGMPPPQGGDSEDEYEEE